jgi:hypothetical protein
MVQIQAKELSKSLRKLQEQIKTRLFAASSETLREGITASLMNSQATGETLKGWESSKVMSPGVASKKVIVGRFNKGNAELLQLGTKASSYGDKYPDWRYIPDWIERRGLQSKFPSGWAVVGRPETTRWGTPRNRWLDNGANFWKGNIKTKGIEELNKIKL